MKVFLIALMRGFLNFLYFFIKLFTPVHDKITYISRQGDEPGIDFRMLYEKLEKDYPQYEQKMLCRMIPKSKGGMVKYAFHILTQMKHIAGSKVVILDTYCIPVSVLKHRKGLEVIQIWHALGAFKKFGLSIVGQDEGSSVEIADAMRMHKGYTYAVASGDCCVPHFAEAFGTDEKKFLPIGLPRMDYLAELQYIEKTKARVYDAYPELLNGKQTILYVPTFRRSNGVNDYTMQEAQDRVRAAADLDRFNLIIKTHSGSELVLTDSTEKEGRLFMGMDLIAVSDYIISDYSSIVFEAAVTLKGTYLYCYDRNDYVNLRGFYLDYDKDIPAIRSTDIGEIMAAIADGKAPDEEEIKAFADKYVSRKHGNVTDLFAVIIDELIRGVYDGRFNYGK